MGEATLYGRLPATRTGPSGRCSRIQSDRRKSPVTIVRFGGALSRRNSARSRSISNAVTLAARAVSSRVSAPRPGPISKNTSPGAGAIARTTLATHAGSRKCCPNRLRAAPGGLAVTDVVPVFLLDLLDFLFAQPEVMPDLVDERFADCHHEIVVIFGRSFEGALEEEDPIGQNVAVAPRPVGERSALVEAE